MTFTVCIPTCYGGESIIETVRSIRASKNVDNFRVLVVADSIPFPEEVKTKLKELGVEIFWNDTPGTQMKKNKQMFDMVSSDLVVSTQDDIIFNPDTLNEIVKALESDPKLTMAGARIFPLPQKTFFESIMATMLMLAGDVGRRWNNGDNRLMASGRCLTYRTEHLRKMKILPGVANSDIYMYLENKRLGGKFASIKDAFVYIRCPQRLHDQIGPSSRYQYGKTEMVELFGEKVKKEYPIPFGALVGGLVSQFTSTPIHLALYCFVFAYLRIFKQARKNAATAMWKIDASTKNIK